MGPETEPLKLAETLLRQCLTDFSSVFACRDPLNSVCCKKVATKQDNGVSGCEACVNVDFLGLCHGLVARLNALVRLSRAVFKQLRQAAPRLRRVFLVAVYRILSLALCNGQRAVRCAAIRCLRHYVRSNSDADLLLANRLDLFITRCFDLSYQSSVPAAESSECTRRNVVTANASSPAQPPPPQQTTLDVQAPALFGNRLMRPGFRRRIQPGSRLSEDRSDILRFSPSATTKPSLQDRIGAAASIGLISARSERLQVLRLAYQLLRLAPHYFPPTLVQALVSSCLGRGSITTAGGGSDHVVGAGSGLAAGNANDWFAAHMHQPPPAAETLFLLPDAVADDPHMRACLLILVEFVLLHNSREPTTTPSTTTAAKTISSCAFNSRQTLLALRNCAKCVQQVFVSDLASCENVKHPVLLLETLLLVLISLADCPYGRRLLGPDTFQKFLVPFTTSFPLVSIPRSTFDTYPDSITFSIGALILLLRSWPGIFYFLSVEGQQCLCTLTQSLITGSSKLRLRILCLLYSLLPGLPFPRLPTASGAQQFPLQRRKFQQQYQLDVSRLVQTLRRTALSNTTLPEPFPNLDGDFVVDEGCRVFGRPRYRLAGASVDGGGGTNLIEAHTSLLLCLLTNAGILEGLVSAAGDANPLASAAAAQLLGFLAYKSNTLLPLDHPCSQRLRSLIICDPASRSSCLTVDQISRVHAVLEDFDKYTTTLLDICAPLLSPFLEQLACQARTGGGLCPRAGPSSAFRSAGLSPEASVHTTTGLSSAVIPPLRRWSPPSGGSKATTTVFKPLDDLLDNVFVQSRVIVQSPPLPSASCKLSSRRTTFSISQKPYSWNWDVLATWARSLSAINRPLSWKAPQRQAFLRRLFDFLTPDILLLSLPLDPTARNLLPGDTKSACAPLSSFYASLLSHKRSKSSTNDVLCLPNLAWTAQAWTESWAAGVLLGGLLPHLTLYPADSLPGQLLRQFLQSIRQCLRATLEYEGAVDVHAGAEPPPPTSNLHLLFQTVTLQKLCSPLLLFAVGRVASCDAGYELLTSLGLTDAVFQLLQRPTLVGVYRPVEVQINLNRRTLLLTKILLASSNFASNEGLGQRLLVTAFRCGTESVRLFAVKFIRLILRMGLRADPDICISFLLRSLFDSSRPVAEEAMDVLEEACEVGGPYLKVISEYCNGSGDPTVLAIVTKNSGAYPASGAAGDSEKCRLLHLPLLLLTPEAGLTGHRVFASVLSTSAIFIRFVASSPLTSNLVYWMLSTWRQFYNERYAINLQHQLSALFQLERFNGRSNTAAGAPIPSCPACGFQAKSLLLSSVAGTSKTPCLNKTACRLPDVADSFESDPDLLMRRSNATSTFKSLLACIADGLEKAEDFTVAAAPGPSAAEPSTAHLFPEFAGPVVPVHLYSCLAMHDAGFDLLCDQGGLEEMVNILSTYIAFCREATSSDQSSALTTSSIQAAIWALSHVLVTQRGSTWSRATVVVENLTRIVSLGKSMSLRGTAWLGLCFIASSQCGANLISRLGSSSKPEPPHAILTWCVVRTGRLYHISPLLPRQTLCLSPKLHHGDLTPTENTGELPAPQPAFSNLPSRKISAPPISDKERNTLFCATCEQTQELFEQRYSPMMCSDSHHPPKHAHQLSLNTTSSLPRPTSRWFSQFPSGNATPSILRPAFNIFKALSIKSRGCRGTCSKSSGSSNQAPEQLQQALVGIGGKDEVTVTTVTNNTPTEGSIDNLSAQEAATAQGMRQVVSDGRLEDAQQQQQSAWSALTTTYPWSSFNDRLEVHTERPKKNVTVDDALLDFHTPTADFCFRGIVLPSDVRLFSDVWFSAVEKSQPPVQSLDFVPSNEMELAAEMKVLTFADKQQRLNGFCSQPCDGPSENGLTGSSAPPSNNGFCGVGETDYTVLASASPTSVVALYSCPLGCVSQSCRLSGRSQLRAVEIERVDAWRENLLSVVEDSLNTVLLARSESALVDLLTEAASDIGVNYVNACIFTEVSCTLAAYTFTRPARTMLQSFLSSFPLPELLNDAKSALDELGGHLVEISEH